jgi:hypothetical protein
MRLENEPGRSDPTPGFFMPRARVRPEPLPEPWSCPLHIVVSAEPLCDCPIDRP